MPKKKTTIREQMLDAAGIAPEPVALPTAPLHRIDPQRNGDRGDGDSAPPRLPVFVRTKDLIAAGIVHSLPQVLRYIKKEGFPPGRMLSPNIRAWKVEEVLAWLDKRPETRKVPPPVKEGSKPRGRPRKPVETAAATEA
jgi:predicted DNA-binding transcriptional regulator AlpA